MTRAGLWVFVLALGATLTTAHGDVIGHNGNGGSVNHPTYGTSDVTFSETHNSLFGLFPISGTNFTKTFHAMDTHFLNYRYETVYSAQQIQNGDPFIGAPPTGMEPNANRPTEWGMRVTEHVVNDTGQAWGGYRFGLMSADFYPIAEAEIGTLPPLSLTEEYALFGASAISLIDDLGFDNASLGQIDFEIVMEGTGPVVTLMFENELADGASIDLSYLVDYLDLMDPPTGPDGFSLFQEPIPVGVIPAPGALALAVIGLGAVKCVRRRIR